MRLAPMFCNNIVLLRDKECNVWGQSNTDVVITVDGVTVSAKSVDGKFMAKLAPHSAGGPFVLKVEGDGEVIEIENVYFGEVFLASGQSNMAFTLSNLPQPLDEPTEVVRMFTYERPWSESNNPAMFMRWLDINEQNASGLSAAASHFAIELANKLKVPVGIVCNAQGGANIQSWTSGDVLENDKQYCECGWVFDPEKDLMFNPAHYLYDNSLLKVAPYTVRGVIWYQGESNADAHTSAIYAHLFDIMTKNWRELWNEPDMPFITVQIAPLKIFEGEKWEEVWNQQFIAYRNCKNVGLVTTGDIGDINDIHPREKKTLGKRLASCALNMIYGFEPSFKPAYCNKATFEDGVVTLKFEDANGSLYATKELEFVVCDENGVSHKCNKYEICGEVVKLYVDGICPSEVSFCNVSDNEVYLYSAVGMPVYPFTVRL